MHGYLAGLITDGIKIFPLVASQPREQGTEARYARLLGIKLWNTDGKIEPSEGASRLTGFRAKLPHQRAEVAHGLGSEGRVKPIRAQGRPGAPSLFFLVDSGADLTCLPAHLIEALGLPEVDEFH